MSNRDSNDAMNTSTGGGVSGGGAGATGGTGASGGAGGFGGGGSTGLAGTGATDAGTTRDTGSTGLAATSGGGTGAGTGTGGGAGAATGLAAQAKEYGQKVADAATSAREYVTDKASAVGTVVSDKFRDIQNMDYRQVAEEAKEYARQKPGQALLISAAAGFVIGLLLRGSRR
jgi:ElaB/YqjD/DUF883 family membrane-anchored ribosome-binding protein